PESRLSLAEASGRSLRGEDLLFFVDCYDVTFNIATPCGGTIAVYSVPSNFTSLCVQRSRAFFGVPFNPISSHFTLTCACALPRLNIPIAIPPSASVLVQISWSPVFEARRPCFPALS